MADVRIFNPDGLTAPASPFFQIATAHRFAFIAGQVSVDKAGNLVGENDFEAQCEQVFANIGAALAAAGTNWGNIVQFTSYLVRGEDVAPFTAWRKKRFPKLFPTTTYPPNTLLVISRLASPAYLLEVQPIAAL